MKDCRKLGEWKGEPMINDNRRKRRGGDADMWRFKGCPKCGGDLFVDYDVNGWYEQCLQCGYLHDLKTILQVKEEKPAKAEKKEFVLAGQHRRATHNN